MPCVVEDAVPLGGEYLDEAFTIPHPDPKAISTNATAHIDANPRIAAGVFLPKLIVEDLRSGAGVEPGRHQESDRLLAGELAEDVRLPPGRILAVDLPHLPQE